MIKRLCNPRITLLHKRRSSEATTEECMKYLPRRLPGQTMGQMGSLHQAHHHHRMRKDL